MGFFDDPKGLSRQLRIYAIASTIPMVMVAGPLVGFFLGRFLDGKLGTTFLMPLVTLLGLVASLIEVANLIGQVAKLTDGSS